MPWIDVHQPVVPMAFIGAQGEINATVDLFPSRVEWHGDPDEAVGALAVAMLQSGGGNRWNRHVWGEVWREGAGHPLATYAAGALVIHLAKPLPNAAVWRTDGTTVTAPDGQTWDTTTFCGHHALGWKPGQDRKLPTLLETGDASTHIHAVVRGVLLSLDMAPASTDVPALCRLVAALAPTRQGKTPSGAGQDKAAEAAMELAALALDNALVRGDRAYAPRHITVLDALFPPETPTNQVWRTAGYDAARIALDSGLSAWALEDLTNPVPSGAYSGHTTLSSAQTIAAIKAAFARHTPRKGA